MKKNKKTYTLYKHTSPSNKVYIGITSKQPVEARWNCDGSGYKDNSYFWRAIKKYGWNNFKHEIIYMGLSKAKAYKYEIQLIKKYNATNRAFGYNIAKGGQFGPDFTPIKTRLKQSKIAKLRFEKLRQDPIAWQQYLTKAREAQKQLAIKNIGKHRNKQFKQNRSRLSKLMWQNKTKKQKLAEHERLHACIRGSKYYNNGKIEIRLLPTAIVPEGFKLGRLLNGTYNSKKVFVLDKNKKIIYTFNSGSETDRQLNLYLGTTKQYIRTGGFCRHKYYFRWAI